MQCNNKNKGHVTLQSSRLWHCVMLVISRRFRRIWPLTIIEISLRKLRHSLWGKQNGATCEMAVEASEIAHAISRAYIAVIKEI